MDIHTGMDLRIKNRSRRREMKERNENKLKKENIGEKGVSGGGEQV